MTTSTSPLANTPMSDTSYTSTIAVAVTSVIVVILLVVLGLFLWKKKKLFGMQYSLTIISTCMSMIQFHENNKYECQQILVIIKKYSKNEPMFCLSVPSLYIWHSGDKFKEG